MHAVVNAAKSGAYSLSPGSVLADFERDTNAMSFYDRGRALVTCTAMHEESNNTARSGETEGAGTEDNQDQHFISFVSVNGHLYELDGRTVDEEGKAFPVDHGPTTQETFAADVAKVIKEEFMARDPESVNFNVTALVRLE